MATTSSPRNPSHLLVPIALLAVVMLMVVPMPPLALQDEVSLALSLHVAEQTQRDLAAEGMFEFGSRVGFWRIMRAFQERGLPLTVFGCALALERNPAVAAAIKQSGFDVCSHGWRWVKHYELTEEQEREQAGHGTSSTKPS